MSNPFGPKPKNPLIHNDEEFWMQAGRVLMKYYGYKAWELGQLTIPEVTYLCWCIRQDREALDEEANQTITLGASEADRAYSKLSPAAKLDLEIFLSERC